MGDDTEKQHKEVGPAGGAAGGTGSGRSPAFADKGHNDGKNHHKGNRGCGGDLAFSQESEQDAESGDVNQSFNVSNRDDNFKPVRKHIGGCEYRQRPEPD